VGFGLSCIASEFLENGLHCCRIYAETKLAVKVGTGGFGSRQGSPNSPILLCYSLSLNSLLERVMEATECKSIPNGGNILGLTIILTL